MNKVGFVIVLQLFFLFDISVIDYHLFLCHVSQREKIFQQCNSKEMGKISDITGNFLYANF